MKNSIVIICLIIMSMSFTSCGLKKDVVYEEDISNNNIHISDFDSNQD